MFSCFIDFTKAFDKVNHWKLFLKLLDDQYCTIFEYFCGRIFDSNFSTNPSARPLYVFTIDDEEREDSDFGGWKRNK